MKRVAPDSPPRAPEPEPRREKVPLNSGNPTIENKIVKFGDKEISKPVIRRQLIEDGFTPSREDKNIQFRELPGDLLPKVESRKRREDKNRTVKNMEGIVSVTDMSPNSLMRWIGVNEGALPRLTHGPEWEKYLATLSTDSDGLPIQCVSVTTESDMILDNVDQSSSRQLIGFLISKQQFGPACNYLLRCKPPQWDGLKALFNAGIEHMALEENDREVFYKVVISAAKAALHEYDEHANNGSSFQLLFNACSHALQLRVLDALLAQPDLDPPPLSLLSTDILLKFLQRGLKDTKTVDAPAFREWMAWALPELLTAGKESEFTILLTHCPRDLQKEVFRKAMNSTPDLVPRLEKLLLHDFVIEMLKQQTDYDHDHGSFFKRLFNACSRTLQLGALDALLAYPDLDPPLSLLPTDILFEFLERGLKVPETVDTPDFREWMARALPELLTPGKEPEFTILFTHCPRDLQQELILEAMESIPRLVPRLVNLASHDTVIEMLKQQTDYYHDHDDDDGSFFKRLFNACSRTLQLSALDALLAYPDLGPPPVSLLPTDILVEFLEQGLKDPKTANDLTFGEWMAWALPELLTARTESQFTTLFTKCPRDLQLGVLAGVTKSAPFFVPRLLNLASHDLFLEFLEQETKNVSDVPQLYRLVTMLGLLSKKDGVNADTVVTLASAMRDAWIRLQRDEQPTPYLAAKIKSAFGILENV